MSFIKKSTYIVLLCLVSFAAFGQEDYRLEDFVYSENIKSVLLFNTISKLSVPVTKLGDKNSLELSFDDLSDNSNLNYRYTVIHCNSDWTVSNLGELEYLDSYTDDRIVNIQASFNTLVYYNHYTVLFPNENINIVKSGNYVIRVFDNNNKTILTKRFCVTEPMVTLFGSCSLGSTVGQIDTHQEVDFTINHKNLLIRNPYTEIKATVLQNFRWDNSIQNIPPLNTTGETMNFDYLGKIAFPAGKEFRWFDLQNIINPGYQVRYIKTNKDSYDVTLYTERPRNESPYFQDIDINGKYLIRQQNPYIEQLEDDIRSDYANILFSLKAGFDFEKSDIYIVGGFTNWQLLPENKLNYNPKSEIYEVELLLKQGLYNYYYAVAENGKITNKLEGDWYETENDYTVLIYYRPVGSRYDRIIGYGTINSRKRS